MLQKSASILRTVLMLMLLIFVNGCQTVQTNSLPKFPHPSKEVGQEINPRCFPRMADTHEVLNLCPHTKDWLAALIKYEKEMAVR